MCVCVMEHIQMRSVRARLGLVVIWMVVMTDALPLQTLSIALIVSVKPTGNLTFGDAFLSDGGHLFATGMAVYRDRIRAHGGWTVGNVTGVIPAIDIFNVGTDPLTAISRASQLASELPASGDYHAVAVMIPPDFGGPLMFAAANEAVGSTRGQPDGTVVLTNTMVADPTKYTHPESGVQLHANSFCTLFPNAFGAEVGRVWLSAHANTQMRSGRKFRFVVMSNNSTAVTDEVVKGAVSAGLELESVVTWRTGSPSTSPEIQQVAARVAALNPDGVFGVCLSTETNICDSILAEWKALDWRPNAINFAGAGLRGPDEDGTYPAMYTGVTGAVPWDSVMKGVDVDVQPRGDYFEPFVTNRTSGVQPPEQFTRAIAEGYKKYPNPANPTAAAIGMVVLIALRAATEVGCADIVNSMAECTATRIANALRQINFASASGRIVFHGGRLGASQFMQSQIGVDRKRRMFAPVSNAEITFAYPMPKWHEIADVVRIRYDGVMVGIAVAICIFAMIGFVTLFGWFNEQRRDSKKFASMIVSGLAGACLLASGTWGTLIVCVLSMNFANLMPDQQLLGYGRATAFGVVLL